MVNKKALTFLTIIFFMISLSSSNIVFSENKLFVDENLEKAVRESLGKSINDPLTTTDLSKLEVLIADYRNISNIDGLEKCTNLTSLSLIGNDITDISNLSNLTNLQDLNLSDNTIKDISSLSKLTDLTTLSISDNFIENIEPIKNLKMLTVVDLLNNPISNIEKLEGIETLEKVYSDHSIKKDNNEIKITFKVGSSQMYVNGISHEIQKSIEIDGRTLLPIRYIIEALGGSISWDEKEEKVSSTLDGQKVVVWINSKKGLVNGFEEYFDVTPRLIDGRTYLPVRFISENLGCEVGWDSEKEMVSISYKKK